VEIAVAAVAEEALPAAHDAHVDIDVAPVAAEYFPSTQEVHVEGSVAENNVWG
tara:strand:+ start:348 stop:506 length:159 start_codon:yes stop_codon:yes gene_type:complete